MKQPRLLDAPLKEGFVEGKIHYWVTPPDILDIWQEEFEFDYDPCPHPRPKGYDGLEAEWGQIRFLALENGEPNPGKARDIVPCVMMIMRPSLI